MAFLRQLVLGIAVIAATLWIWITYIPSAAGWLERAGIAGVLGIEPQPADAAESGGARGWGGGGPAAVVVSEVAEAALNDRITAIGDGRAIRAVTVRSEATGIIEAIEVGAGGYVQAGALLVRLDASAERIAVERARLVLADAQDDVDRLSQLETAGTVSVVAKREAELARRTAELDLREAELELSRRVVRAPISGWIGLTEIEAGDRVSTQDPLMTITDRSRIVIDFRVPERVIGQLSLDMPLEAIPLGWPGTVLEGRVSAIDNVVDRASRTLRVQGLLDNAEDRLRAGMAFKVTLLFPGDPYPAVDPLAVQWSSDGAFVWAVREDKAQRVPIVIRQRNAATVLVEAELSPGDLVVTEGVQTLRPGAEVRIAGPGEAKAVTDAGAGGGKL